MANDDPAPLNYGRQARPRRYFWWLWLIATVAVIALLAGPKRPQPRVIVEDSRIRCSSNLRQIGQAILLFSNDHGGRYPDRLDQLFEEEIGPEVFVCRLTNDTPAMGPTTRAMGTSLTAGGHLSYIYVGRGLTTATATASAVVVYEPSTNHPDGSVNVLFGDGSVRLLQGKEAQSVLKQIAEGPATAPIVRLGQSVR